MLSETQIAKVEQLLAKLPEVEQQLSDSAVTGDPKKMKEIGQQHSYLSDLQEAFFNYRKMQKELVEAKVLLREAASDRELAEMAEQELERIQTKLPQLAQQIESLLVPPDLSDDRPTILEIRAGTGGEEAALFVADMVRMYKLYADSRGWRVEPLSATESDQGGFREYIMVISGPQAYRLLKHEAGTHRVQRVPATESQGRIHTSATTVAALMEPDDQVQVNIREQDLRIDTCRSSGAGGQHVNTTDSAVRITHLPTGIVVFCQEERSQIKNRDKAMRVLRARVQAAEESRRAQEVADLRSSMVGSGDRSERIRTYNFPQNRITDHRINLTLYNLDRVMEGDLDALATALVQHFYRQRLEAAGAL